VFGKRLNSHTTGMCAWQKTEKKTAAGCPDELAAAVHVVAAVSGSFTVASRLVSSTAALFV